MKSQDHIETTTYVRARSRERPLSPREIYVLRAAPVFGIGRRGITWLVRDEDLSGVVESLRRRGLLALRDARPPCADLTEAGRVALSASRAGAGARP